MMLQHVIKRLHHTIERKKAIVPFRKAPLVLLILDGWGYDEKQRYNAIAQAHTPFWDQLWKNNPRTLLDASGASVGLPQKQVGNSEVGHMHIGAGRRIPQDLTRLEESIQSGDFHKIPLFNNTLDKLKKTGRTLHILGLLSPGGVHSHENHLFAFLTMCQHNNFDKIALHLFLDGRDCPPKSALQSIERLEKQLMTMPGSTIASIVGRHYALDRNNNWDRTELVYQLLTEGRHKAYYETADQAVKAYYEQRITDEHIPPTQIAQARLVEDNDTIFFFNFRTDRARQLTESFIASQFNHFQRKKYVRLDNFISMTKYADHLKTTPVFPPIRLKNTLGEYLSNMGIHQLRLAETEKYAHVTFFLNGGLEKPFPHEARILIPSPNVHTYDLQPEMSAEKITEQLIAEIIKQKYEIIICNLANADMVGHTGNLNATIRAIECIDSCLKKIVHALMFSKGTAIITADHGNAEKMFDEASNQPHTAHTSAFVPCLYVGPSKRKFIISDHKNSLIDIAPTLLELLQVPKPEEMSGKSLLETKHSFFNHVKTNTSNLLTQSSTPGP